MEMGFNTTKAFLLFYLSHVITFVRADRIQWHDMAFLVVRERGVFGNGFQHEKSILVILLKQCSHTRRGWQNTVT